MQTNKCREKPFEIFCGTGGVGKTTLATARALHHAALGRKVLLITIDPAHRLKQLLSLKDSDAGFIKTVPLTTLGISGDEGGHLDALLMSPTETMRRISKQTKNEEIIDNPIIAPLIRPYGGMNEILSVVEVQHHLTTGNYDVVVLDTPPGKHFIDFLSSCEKIQSFFDSSFVEIFRYLGKPIDSNFDMHKKVIGLIVSTGIKKLLAYLEFVTGGSFIEQFIAAVWGIYQSRECFLNALTFQDQLRNPLFSNWFFVTSIEQHNNSDSVDLRTRATGFMHEDSFVVMNKVLRDHLNTWEIPPGSPLMRFKESLIRRENRIRKSYQESKVATLEFPEMLTADPREQLELLVKCWDQ